MFKFKDMLQIYRPSQWIKNVFVLLPLFFAGKITDIDALWQSLIAFIAFCAAASSIYCINDILDLEDDRAHEKKRNRPLASGRVTVGSCILMSAIAGAFSIGVPFVMPQGWKCSLIIGTYILLNIFYCFKLKHIALVDTTCIALGFVLRIAAGAVASDIWLSHWIVLMTFLLTLFLALSKRRDDVIIYNCTGKSPRKNTTRYNLSFLAQANTLVATVTLVCYILYTVSPEVIERMESNYVYISAIFVLLGILRYFQTSTVDKDSGSPTRIALHDRFLQICIGGWIIFFAAIIYL